MGVFDKDDKQNPEHTPVEEGKEKVRTDDRGRTLGADDYVNEDGSITRNVGRPNEGQPEQKETR